VFINSYIFNKLLLLQTSNIIITSTNLFVIFF